MRPNKDRQNLWLWAALLLPLLWLAAGLAQITEQAHGLSALAAGLTALLNDPLNLRWCSSTPKFLLAVLVLYRWGCIAIYSIRRTAAPARNTALPIGAMPVN